MPGQENERQRLIHARLMRLGGSVLLSRVAFDNLTDEQCQALQYCINNIESRLRRAEHGQSMLLKGMGL